VDQFLTWIIDAVQSMDPVLRTLIAGVAIMLETSILIGLIVPGDTIVLVTSVGVTDVWQGVFLVIAVVIGSLLGESIGFWLGRWIGPHIRHSRVGRWIGEEHWVRSERYLQRRGGIAIFLSRFLPVLHSLVPLTVGMGEFAYRRFIAWTVPACVLWATVYVSVGALVAGSYKELADRVHYAGYLFVGAIVLFLVIVFVVKKVISRREEHHMSDADGPEA
jgi:membrane protein DedA with SNARE-associated domain